MEKTRKDCLQIDLPLNSVVLAVGHMGTKTLPRADFPKDICRYFNRNNAVVNYASL